MLFGFLFLSVGVIRSWSQSTARTDSVCLCGNQKEIDSTLKILNDYPDLKQQAFLLTKLLDNERRLTELDKRAILNILGLKCDWDIGRIKRRIWWLRHGRPIVLGLGGVGVGVIVGVLTF